MMYLYNLKILIWRTKFLLKLPIKVKFQFQLLQLVHLVQFQKTIKNNPAHSFGECVAKLDEKKSDAT